MLFSFLILFRFLRFVNNLDMKPTSQTKTEQVKVHKKSVQTTNDSDAQSQIEAVEVCQVKESND